MSGARGEYRTWYVSAWDDDDFIGLPPLAKLVVRYLKDTLGALSIGRFSAVKAARLIGCTDAELEAALAELEAPKEGRSLGWIVRGERSVVWIVNGLRFEQSLSPLNEKKHVPYVRRMAEQLDPELDVVQAFFSYYPEWFGDGPRRAPAAAEPASEPHRVLIPYAENPDRVSIHERRETRAVDGSVNSDSDSRARATGSDPASPASPSLARLSQLRREFVDEIYGAALVARRLEVESQLSRVLTPDGVKLGRGQVAYATPDSLASALAATLQQFRRRELRDPDKAIRVALLKCHSGPANIDLDGRGRTATEAAAADAKAREAAEERDAARRLDAAQAWLAAHPDEAAEIVAQVDRKCPDKPGLARTREALIVDLVEQLRAEFAGASA